MSSRSSSSSNQPRSRPPTTTPSTTTTSSPRWAVGPAPIRFPKSRPSSLVADRDSQHDPTSVGPNRTERQSSGGAASRIGDGYGAVDSTEQHRDRGIGSSKGADTLQARSNGLTGRKESDRLRVSTSTHSSTSNLQLPSTSKQVRTRHVSSPTPSSTNRSRSSSPSPSTSSSSRRLPSTPPGSGFVRGRASSSHGKLDMSSSNHLSPFNNIQKSRDGDRDRGVGIGLDRPNSKVLTSFPFEPPKDSSRRKFGAGSIENTPESKKNNSVGLFSWLTPGSDNQSNDENGPSETTFLSTSFPTSNSLDPNSNADLDGFSESQNVTSLASTLKYLISYPVHLILGKENAEEEERIQRDEEEAVEILEREALLHVETQKNSKPKSQKSNFSTSKSKSKSQDSQLNPTSPLIPTPISSSLSSHSHYSNTPISSDPLDPYGYRALAGPTLLPSHATYLEERRRERSRARQLRNLFRLILALIGLLVLVLLGVGGVKWVVDWRNREKTLMGRWVLAV